MRSSTLLILVAGTAAYVPSVAEWSKPLNLRKALDPEDKGNHRLGRDVYTGELASDERLHYVVDVKIGNQNVLLDVDTGSHSIWTATPRFSCPDSDSGDVLIKCDIKGLYDPYTDVSAVYLDHVDYAMRYLAGNVNGEVWNTTVTVAGLQVQNFTIGFVHSLSLSGSDNSSGVIGLGRGRQRDLFNSSGIMLEPMSFFGRLKEKLNKWQFAM